MKMSQAHKKLKNLLEMEWLEITFKENLVKGLKNVIR